MENRMISVQYQLYVDGDNEKELIEETREDQPYMFITGFGTTLDALEKAFINMQPGEEFDLTLTPEEAYGQRQEEYVIEVAREVFTINGHFDHDNVYVDAIVPLQNEEGHRFNGRVIEIGEEQVKIDLNHPFAGQTLYFKGKIQENREATQQEVDHLMKHLTGGCGGDCSGCGGGCDHEHHHEDCGCGHCH